MNYNSKLPTDNSNSSTEHITLNITQKLFVIYGVLYSAIWIKYYYRLNITSSNLFFLITSTIMLCFSFLVLVSNHKHEEKRANQNCCYAVAFLGICAFIYQLYTNFHSYDYIYTSIDFKTIKLWLIVLLGLYLVYTFIATKHSQERVSTFKALKIVFAISLLIFILCNIY